MPLTPGQKPDSGDPVSGTNPSWSGTPARGADPTNLAGQYPPGAWGNALFGGPLGGSGAPGSQGATYSRAADDTNEPGQLNEGLSGLGPADIARSGAPGMATTPNGPGGGSKVTYTRPGAGVGTFHSDTYNIDLSGPKDSTQANDEGYATGGPQLPGIAGNEPQPGSNRYQTGRGTVLRGGRDVRP